MSTDLVKADVNAVSIVDDLKNTEMLVKQLMQTKHYAAMGEVGVYAIVHKARALGVNPIDALNGGLYVVSGKVGMSTELMASLIRAQGHSITKDSKSTDVKCILNGKRKDTGDTWQCSFSIEDAKKAGIYKSSWEKYPGIMCYNRAMSMLARQLFPDVIKGAGYTMDELKEIARVPEGTIDVVTIDMNQAQALMEMIDTDHNPEEALSKVLLGGKCQDIYSLPLDKFESACAYLTRRRESVKPKEISDILEVVSSTDYQSASEGI